MPLIPAQDEPAYKAAPAPALNAAPVAPLEAYGGGDALAATIQEARGAAHDVMAEQSKLAAEQKALADNTALYEASTRLSQLQNSLLYDDQTGALKTQGKNAFGIYPEVMQNFQKGANGIMNDLSTDEQRMAFQRQIYAHAADMDRSLKVHIAGQRQQYTENTLKTSIAQYGDSAQLAANDPIGRQMALDRQKAALQDLATFGGLHQESADQFIAEEQSKTQLRIIDSLINSGNDLAAKEYYEAHEQEMVGKPALMAQEAVKRSSMLGEAQRQAEAILAPRPIKLGGPAGQAMKNLGDEYLSETDALAEARKTIEDPKIQEMAIHEIKTRFVERRQAEELDYHKLLQSAANLVEQYGDMSAIPESQKMQIKRTDLSGLAARAMQIKRGEEPVTSPELFEQLYRQASDPDTRNDFVKRNLVALRSDLSRKDFEKFVEMQGNILKDDPATTANLNFHQRIEDTLLSNKVFNEVPAKLGTTDRQRYANFELQAFQRLAMFETAEKRKAKPAEAQHIIDQMLQEKSEQRGMLWNSEKIQGTILPEETVLPEAKAREFTIYLNSIGKKVSDDKMRRMLRAAQLGDTNMFKQIANE